MRIILRQLLGVITAILTVLNLAFCFFVLLMPVTIVKFIIPIHSWRLRCSIIMAHIAHFWVGVNGVILRATSNIKWNISDLEDLKMDESYLVISNHQSWVDIVVLFDTFTKKIPLLRFFVKMEIARVPMIGPAVWALDMPLIKRYSKAFLEKNPHLKGEDIAITKRACKKFKDLPTSIVNFVEGTRFTEEKHMDQESPYKHLLRPRAGGIAFVLNAIGEQLSHILNVTVYYPDGIKSLWQMMCGEINEVIIKVEKIPVTGDHIGDYLDDNDFKIKFQRWLSTLWKKNDDLQEELRKKRSAN
ncbi:acyltransferase [Spirochaetota bacterium]